MSRTYHHVRGLAKFKGYGKESTIAKKLWRRKRRNDGKRLMEDDNPDKGTQGWLTW